MKNQLLSCAAMLVLPAASLNAQTLTIDHRPVGCAVAEKFPRFDARFAPGDNVAVARILFRSEKSDQWWAVSMKPEGPSYVGVLPKPKKSLKAFEYYIEVTDKALSTTRTADHTATVVESSGACSGKLMAGSLGSAGILLQGPAGITALPAGFASTGVVAAGSASATAGAGSAGAAGGGGIGTGLIVAAVGAAAAGVAVAVVPKGDSGSDSSIGSTGPAPPATYDVTFQPQPPGINVSACASAPTTFSGLASIQVTATGSFDAVHSQNTPVLRVAGQVTSTNFQATLTCTNGAQSGSISATGANNSYSGTFVFGSQQGQVTVAKR